MENGPLTLARRILAGGLVSGLLAAVGARAALPPSWDSVGIGGGGAFFAPSWSPHAPDEIYMTSDMSGVYHSTDRCQHWSLVDFRQHVGDRGAAVQFTADPNVLWALDYTGDSPAPAKSGDGGVTWTRAATDPTGGGAFALYGDPSSVPPRLVVSDYTTLYFSGDDGQTWQSVYTNANGGNGLYVAGAYFNGTTIAVGTSVGLVESNDGGANFFLAPPQGLPAGESMVSFAGGQSGGITRYLCITQNAADVYPGLYIESQYASYQHVFALAAPAPGWVTATNGIAAGDYPAFVAMSPASASVAYVAGQQDTTEYPILYKTTDGGQSWTSVYFPAGNVNIATGWQGSGGDQGWSWGAGALGLAVSPTDTNRVAYTDLGFVHLTTDGGTSWHQGYLNPADENPAGAPTPKYRAYRGIGAEVTSCWGVTWLSPTRVYGCMTDVRAILTDDAGASWSMNYTGPLQNTMYRAVVQPGTGNVYAAESSIHDLYQSTHLQDSRIDGGTGGIVFSTDSGATWQWLHQFGPPVIWVALDPTHPNRLYASVVHSAQGGIYVTDDVQDGAASVWRQVTNPPRTQGHPYVIQVLTDGSLVASFSGRRDLTLNRFTDSSGVFYSTDGGSTWADRTGPNMHAWVKDVVIDPHDPTQSTWYAGVFNAWGGFGNGFGGLYETTDKGLNWTRLTSGMSVESCTMDPANPAAMYFTTETDGLWYSSNRQAATPTFAQVAEYPFMHPLRLAFNPNVPGEVWATSFGNGIRIGRVAVTAPTPRPVADGVVVHGTPLRALKVTPNGATIRLLWDVTTCPPSTDYATLWGVGSALRAYGLSGSACAMGTSGTYDWTTSPAVPAGERLIWLVIVGTNGAGSESSWGADSFGREENGAAASQLCNSTVKDTTATCP